MSRRKPLLVGEGSSPRGVVVNVLEYNIVVNELESQSGYYVHFLNIILEKDINFIIPQLCVRYYVTVLLIDWFWH